MGGPFEAQWGWRHVEERPGGAGAGRARGAWGARSRPNGAGGMSRSAPVPLTATRQPLEMERQKHPASRAPAPDRRLSAGRGRYDASTRRPRRGVPGAPGAPQAPKPDLRPGEGPAVHIQWGVAPLSACTGIDEALGTAGLDRQGGGMTEHVYAIYVGIDWATAAHQVTVLDPARRLLAERAVPHTGEALAECVTWLITLADGRPDRVAVAIEVPRGAVVDVLLERGCAVFALNPKQLDRFRDRHTVAGAKDDRRDAFVLGGCAAHRSAGLPPAAARGPPRHPGPGSGAPRSGSPARPHAAEQSLARATAALLP